MPLRALSAAPKDDASGISPIGAMFREAIGAIGALVGPSIGRAAKVLLVTSALPREGKSVLVAAAGDIVAGDPPPGKRGWRVGIGPGDNPDAAPTRFISLANAAVSTSGDAYQFVEIGGKRKELTARVPDHAVAVGYCLEQLTDPADGCLKDAAEVAAIGFKAVHGGRYSGTQIVTPEVLSAMEEMSRVAPAHNPPYITAM